jgi:hypothetical protein
LHPDEEGRGDWRGLWHRALLEKKFAMISCRMEEAEDIRGCARRREREECRREGARQLHHAKIGEGRRRRLRASAQKLSSLVEFLWGEKEEDA